MKKCNGCGKFKEFDAFHKNRANKTNGCQNYCKVCTLKRSKLPKKTKAQKQEGIYKEYIKDCSIKEKARTLSAKAIKDGVLVRGDCELCGSNDHVEGHHDDYSQPVTVRWLCRSHHRQWHRENGAALNGYDFSNLSSDIEINPCRDKCRAGFSSNHEACLGCKRTIKQINDWPTYTEIQKREIMRPIIFGDDNNITIEKVVSFMGTRK